jgi:hypothetical protein
MPTSADDAIRKAKWRVREIEGLEFFGSSCVWTRIFPLKKGNPIHCSCNPPGMSINRMQLPLLASKLKDFPIQQLEKNPTAIVGMGAQGFFH